MNDLKVGDRHNFFHPGTMGVMLMGTVVKVGKAACIVKFDDPHPTNGKRTFWTYKDFN
jgi:hypothetical protein